MELQDLAMWFFLTFLIIIIFVFIIMMPITLFFLSDIGASQGQHTGYISAVEFNKNILWDANIVYFKTDMESTQEDRYCVNDNLLNAKLEQYARNNQQLTIQYSNPFWFWRSLCNGGDSIIYNAEVYNGN